MILAAFTSQVLQLATAGRPLTRDLAARGSVYLLARTQYGIVDPAGLAALRQLWQTVLGEHDLRALDELYGRLVWIPDGALERLDDAAQEYRRIVGEPDPPSSTGGCGQAAGSGEGGGGGASGGRDVSEAEGGRGAGALADALEQAIAWASADQLEQLDQDVDLDQVLHDAARREDRSGNLGRGRGTGLPSGRMPDRGVDRRPRPTRSSTPAAMPPGCAKR